MCIDGTKSSGNLARSAIALLIASSWSTTTAWSQSPTATSNAPSTGRFVFDYQGDLEATVEIDLGRGMVSDIVGILQSAVQGSADGLVESVQGPEAAEIRQSAAHLAEIQQLASSLTGVIQEVQVRIYDDKAQDSIASRNAMWAHYRQRLDASEWDNVIRIREGDTHVLVGILRDEGVIRGILAMVAEGNEVVLTNIVCELSPAKAEQLANLATKLGLKFGLDRALRNAIRQGGP